MRTMLQNTNEDPSGRAERRRQCEFALFGQNRNDGSNLHQTRKVQFSNIVADPVQCAFLTTGRCGSTARPSLHRRGFLVSAPRRDAYFC